MSVLVLRNVRPFGGEPDDLALADGKIIAASQVPADVRHLDCTGLIALPGLVDLHTHLREPGPPEAETIESGTSAARGAVEGGPGRRPPAGRTQPGDRHRRSLAPGDESG